MDNFIWGVIATSLFTLIGLVWKNVQSDILKIEARQEVNRTRIESLERHMEVLKSLQGGFEKRHDDNRNYLKERFDQLEELIKLKIDQGISKQRRSSQS
jgi:hypothetical protein